MNGGDRVLLAYGGAAAHMMLTARSMQPVRCPLMAAAMKNGVNCRCWLLLTVLDLVW